MKKYYRISDWQLERIRRVLGIAEMQRYDINGLMSDEEIKQIKEKTPETCYDRMRKQAFAILQAIEHDEVEAPSPVVITTPFIVEDVKHTAKDGIGKTSAASTQTRYPDSQATNHPLPNYNMSPKQYGMSLRRKHK